MKKAQFLISHISCSKAASMICMSISFFLFNNSGYAQLKGTHLLGDMGLQSGTQPPASFMPALHFIITKLQNS